MTFQQLIESVLGPGAELVDPDIAQNAETRKDFNIITGIVTTWDAEWTKPLRRQSVIYTINLIDTK